MIVRKLPTISKRWPPKKQNNEPSRSHSEDRNNPYDWQYKQQQANKSRSSTTAQKYSTPTRTRGTNAQPPNPNQWRNASNTSNRSRRNMQSNNKSPNKQTQQIANKSNNYNAFKRSSNKNHVKPQNQRNIQQNTHNLYSKATQKQSHYAGTHRKLYSNANNAYVVNKKSPARSRNISNHVPSKPLPMNRKTSTASTASNMSNVSSISTTSNMSNGYMPQLNPHINQSQSYSHNQPQKSATKHNRNTSQYQPKYAHNALPNGNPNIMKSRSNYSHVATPHKNKKTIGYYNNTSIRKADVAGSDQNGFSHSNSQNTQQKGRNTRNKVNNSPRNNAHATRRRLHDIFARDKLVKWVHQKNGIYEPIFVVMEQYNGNNKVIVGRDSRGNYRLYQRRNVLESPPSEHDVTMISAVEQLLRGYQLRFKATSLRPDKTVEIVQRSSPGWVSPGSTNAIFAKVTGFQDKNGNINNVLLQDTVHGVKDVFAVAKIQENHTINIGEGSEKVFSPKSSDRKASITQYVKPSYWMSSEDTEKKQKEEEKKRKEIEQQQGLLQKIEAMKNETKKLQEEISTKIKVIHRVDLKDKADKTGIAALNVLWAEILKRNNTFQVEIEKRRSETDSWRKIAVEHQNENRLLKQRMTHIKSQSLTTTPKIVDIEKECKESEALQHELKKKGDKIHKLSQQNTKLEQQIADLQRKVKEEENKGERHRLTPSKMQIVIDENIETDENLQDFEAENISLKKQLSEIRTRQHRATSNLSTFSTQSTHSELMQRGGGMMVDSSFVTVKDTLTEFHSLRDQEYHKLHVELKKSLKSHRAKTWHKLYINQVCHGFMFEVLQMSYKYIRKYTDAIYQGIGEMLCIDQVVYDSKEKQREKLDYVFLFYLKENHTILYQDFKAKEMEKLIDKTKQIYNKKTQIQLSAELYVLLTRYIAKCCTVCWLMILQRPKLTLYPKEFKPALKSVVFDTEIHSKTMGSDRKSSHVLYYVWPTVKNGVEKLGFNIQVIVRDTDVPSKRRKK